jgi:hypothetical protein
LAEFLESLGPGVMEHWSVDIKAINLLAITPTLQYSNTPKSIEIEGHHDGLLFFACDLQRAR